MSTVTTIVDTSHTDQNTLDRAFHLAKYKHAPLHLHGMSYGYSSKSGGNSNEQLQLDSKLSDIKIQAQRQGIDTSTSSSFGHLWEVAFLSVLNHQDHPTVITSYPDRHLWSKWIPSRVINRFIFDFPCDVLMVKDKQHWVSHKAVILLGPELSSGNSNNDLDIMTMLGQAANCGKQLESMGLDVYYVCAYPDTAAFNYREELQDISASNDSHIIFCWGAPEQVVPPLIDKLNADLLAVDIVKATAIGRQEGRYIHQLGQLVNCDIMAAH